MTGTPTKNLAELAETWIASFNAGDWAQFRAPLAPNVVYMVSPAELVNYNSC